MIVRAAGDRLHLITQPDHAHLAGRIMERCVPLANRPRRESIVHAIAEHDNGWAEPDAAPGVNADGAVADFVGAPPSVRQGVWPRGVARLAGDPYAAALVAQHAITVYDRYRSEPGWRDFFRGMENARGEMLASSGRPVSDLDADYPFLRLGDLISLVFCTADRTEQRLGDLTVRLSGERVVVSPDLFGGAEVPFEIAARSIPARRYASDLDLRTALDRAAPAILRGVLTTSA
jgi:hypothetical protein